MKIGSLFSGVGGFDEGFRAAGMEIAWQCEADERCLEVLRYRYPGTKTYEDVRGIDGETVEPVDVLCGGFPCQDLSVAGRRAGLAGERSGLFHQFMRIASECSPSPRWVVIENVPGLLSSNGGRDMATVLGALEELGYGWAYRCLDSQFFGVPQRRRRVFIVGCLGGWRGAAKILFESESVCGDPQKGRKAGEGVAHTTVPCLAASGRGVERCGESRGQDPVVAFTQNQRGELRTSQVSPQSVRGNKSDGDHTGMVCNQMQVRRLTPKECERLQGFSDDWTRWGRTKDGEVKEVADGPRYKMLGNAVTVQVAEWIGRRIMGSIWANVT